MDAALASGQMIAGTPETFVAEIRRQAVAIGVNYMNFSFFFGTMALERRAALARPLLARGDAEAGGADVDL